MKTSIHGHEVMQFMIDQGGGFTRAGLLDAIARHFGAEARFHTCSAEDMNAVQLIDFLASRGKFVEGANGFNTQADKLCSHGDGPHVH